MSPLFVLIVASYVFEGSICMSKGFWYCLLAMGMGVGG